jgi:hypothetical protein
MDEALMRSLASALKRCDQEIREIERLLRTGHLDTAGLLRALNDWAMERRLILSELEDARNGTAWTGAATDGA